MLKNRHKFNINGIAKNISTFFDLFYTIPLTTQINKKPFIRRVQRVFGELVGIRTPNLLIRSEVLYPVELQVHLSKFDNAKLRLYF